MTCCPMPRSVPSTIGSAPFPGAASGPGAGGYGGGYVDFEDLFGGGFGGMGDIFSTFFGGGGAQGRQMRKNGRDMSIGLRITLEEAASGITKEVVYDRLAPVPRL